MHAARILAQLFDVDCSIAMPRHLLECEKQVPGANVVGGNCLCTHLSQVSSDAPLSEATSWHQESKHTDRSEMNAPHKESARPPVIRGFFPVRTTTPEAETETQEDKETKEQDQGTRHEEQEQLLQASQSEVQDHRHKMSSALDLHDDANAHEEVNVNQDVEINAHQELPDHANAHDEVNVHQDIEINAHQDHIEADQAIVQDTVDGKIVLVAALGVSLSSAAAVITSGGKAEAMAEAQAASTVDSLWVHVAVHAVMSSLVAGLAGILIIKCYTAFS